MAVAVSMYKPKLKTVNKNITKLARDRAGEMKMKYKKLKHHCGRRKTRLLQSTINIIGNAATFLYNLIDRLFFALSKL
jgi:precorrin isomerase